MRSLSPLAACFLTAIALAFPGTARADTVTGTVRTAAGLPVAGVTIEFSGGVTPLNPTTDANGVFTITVVAGTYDIDFLPPQTTLAPRQYLGAVVAGTLNLGIVTLAPGFLLSGVVRTTAMAPIVGADINVYDAVTGEKLLTPTDNTTATGSFGVIVPAGTFDVRAAPPAGQLFVAILQENVVVSGPLTLPAFTLPPGFVLSGTVRNSQTMAAIVGGDIDVDNALTGARVQTPSDDTSATGAFSVIVPAGTFNITIDPPAGLAVQGRRILNVVVTGTTAAGTITLDPGFVLTGTIQRAGNLPVGGCDLDVDRVLGLQRLYTAYDFSEVNGTFRIVVPAGLFHLTITPPTGQALVARRILNLNVTGNQNLGTYVLTTGQWLSGTIFRGNGQIESGGNIDVFNPSTGEEIVTPNDMVAANGTYGVWVPSGTWNVRVRTKKASLYFDLTSSVPVSGPTTYTPGLPLSPVASYLGANVPGQSVPSGGAILVDFALYNPTASGAGGDLVVTLTDPAGGVTTLVPTLPFLLNPGQLIAAFGLPIPLPPANPAHLGLPFRLRLNVNFFGTSTTFETDDFSFLVQ